MKTSKVSIGDAFTPTGLEDEIFEAASAPYGKEEVTIKDFLLPVFRWFDKVQKENEEVISMTKKWGTIHFKCPVNPKHRNNYVSDLMEIENVFRIFSKGYGNYKFVVPNVLEHNNMIKDLNQTIYKKVFKDIGDNTFLVDLLDKDNRCIELDYNPFDKLLNKICEQIKTVKEEFLKQHFTPYTIVKSWRYINSIKNTCFLCNMILPKENEINGQTYETVSVSTSLMR